MPSSPGWQQMPSGENQSQVGDEWPGGRGGREKVTLYSPLEHNPGRPSRAGVGLVSLHPQGTMADSFVAWGVPWTVLGC